MGANVSNPASLKNLLEMTTRKTCPGDRIRDTWRVRLGDPALGKVCRSSNVCIVRYSLEPC